MFAANLKPTSREIEVMGIKRKIFGYESDRYFGEIENHIANNTGLITEICCLKSPHVFLDIGANIGGTSLLAAASGAKIIAVEASPRNAELFRHTMKENNIEAELFQCAAGSGPSEVRFSETDFAAGSHVGKEGEIAVQVRSIDSIVEDLDLHAVDLVKIDVEGYEAEVLRGAQRTLDHFKPVVVMEFNAYAIAMHTDESPRILADMVLDLAGEFEVDARGGMKVHNRETLESFMYQHMIHGCVNDLIWRPKN